ncbi:MAG: threonine synthase [Candidatus Ancillula sp.]|jgi:threonine synthase|nr:threonine synthase [Candidatus Ancillula sp.]
MAHIWQGIIKEYADFMPEHVKKNIVTLGEGGYPLIRAEKVEERLQSYGILDTEVYIKFEGRNPTGSFKDRGMTTAMSAEKAKGTKAVVCASTGNTSASAAAYATKAGIKSVVLVPDGKIAMGKLAQAIAHGAMLLQVDGNFDDCLELARSLSEQYPVGLVNSVNPDRLVGQKTAAFEIIDELGDAPTIHALPVGNAGNITAYWMGYKEYVKAGKTDIRPQMWGFQAAGSAPIVEGHPIENPETIATAIRIGKPASWEKAELARDESQGLIEAVTDQEILAAHRILSAEVGVFVEPASAAGLAGILKKARQAHEGLDNDLTEAIAEANAQGKQARIVITSTGHGLKDPSWAMNELDNNNNVVDRDLNEGKSIHPIKVDNDLTAVAKAIFDYDGEEI